MKFFRIRGLIILGNRYWLRFWILDRDFVDSKLIFMTPIVVEGCSIFSSGYLARINIWLAFVDCGLIVLVDVSVSRHHLVSYINEWSAHYI